MSTRISLKHLSDIIDVEWNIEDGGRIKRKDGTYRSTDLYPRFFYDARELSTVMFRGRSLKWIQFNMISPRTLNHPDKIGKIQITYSFKDGSSNETVYCDEYEIVSWLRRNITRGLNFREREVVDIPLDRQIIQEENRNGYCEEYNSRLSKDMDEEEVDREEEEEYYDDEQGAYDNYLHYSWDDMIQDAFEGDESNYWNID